MLSNFCEKKHLNIFVLEINSLKETTMPMCIILSQTSVEYRIASKTTEL